MIERSGRIPLGARRLTPAVWAIGAHVLLALVSLPGLLELETSADTRVFYGDTVYHRDLKAFEATFRQNNSILLLLRLGGARIDASPDLAAALRDATVRAWRLPLVLRVESLATQPHVRGGDGEFTLVPVLDVLCPDVCRSDEEGLLASPLLRARLVSADATTVAVVVTFDLPFASATAVQSITSSVRGLADELETAHPGLSTSFVGGITMMDAFHEAAQRDAATLVPLVLVVLFGLLILFLGEVRLIALLLATGAYGSLIALGTAGWLGVQLNAATSIVPVVIITLSAAGGLHLLITYLRQRRRTGGDIVQAVTIAVGLNRRPIMLTTITTLIGFLSMNFADAPPLRDLGNLVAIGLISATSFLVCVIPPVLLRMKRLRTLPTAQWINWVVEWLAYRNSNALAIAVLAFALVAVAGTSRLVLNDDFVEYFDDSFEFRRAADFAEVHLGGPNTIDVSLSAASADGIYDPAYMKRLGELSTWLRQDPLVASVISVADVLGEVAFAFTGESDLSRRSRDEIAQYLLAYELSLTAGQDLEDFFDRSRRSTRISVLLSGGNSQSVADLEARIYDWFESHRDPGFGIVVTGINVPVAHMSLQNATSMLKGLAVSLVLITAILGWYFRNLRVVWLSAPAIFLPIAMGFGLWGWFVGEIGIASSVIAAMTIGIIIDDAIHLIFRYRHTRVVLEESPAVAARDTVSSVGLAIVSTSVALAVGFVILGLSGFEVNRTLGLCTTFIVMCGLVVDLLLVPKALVWLDQ